jgi:hypothetical protein
VDSIENNFMIMGFGCFLFIIIVAFLVVFPNQLNKSITTKLPRRTKIKLPPKINFQIESNDNYGVGTFALDLVTGFGHGRAKTAKYNYEIQYHSYATNFNKLIDLQNIINYKLNELGEFTYLTIQELDRSQKLVNIPKNSALNYKEKQLVEFMNKSIGELKAITEIEINTGMVLLQGSTIGGLAALGSWTLVSLFGTASTGTAISTLSGAAAYNATLAWFGGGAIAAGGGGMAAGTMTLIDITGISILLFCSYKSHSKANEITRQTALLITEIDKLRENNKYLENFERSINQEILLLKEKFEKIKNVNSHLENLLYPYGALSMFKRNIAEFFKQDFYTKKEYEEMIQLFKVFDETYNFLSKK